MRTCRVCSGPWGRALSSWAETLGVSWEWLRMKLDGEVRPGWQGLGRPGRTFGACPPTLGLLFSPQVGVPLNSQEVEDIVIYLSSLGKHNSITGDNLASTYKQWSLAQQKSTLATATECTYPPPPPCLHFRILGASVVQAALAHLSVFSSSGLL